MKNRKIKNFLERVLQGVFWILPIAIIAMVIVWLYEKIDLIVNSLFSLVGFEPQSNIFLWSIAVIFLLIVTLYIVGHFVETRLANWTQKILDNIPGYSTIKDIVGIFNSSKKGDTKVLVVLVRGFANQGYNIGLMYSQNESILKDHYTVTLSQTPIPNGGYMFEVHKNDIFIIEEASFDDNLQYLLSMGVKSIKDIIGVESKNQDELKTLSVWLDEKK